MRRLIAKGLGGRALRAWISVSGIAVSTMLVLVLLGAYRSVSTGIGEYLGQHGNDYWIAPRGTDNLIRSSGLLEPGILDEIRKMQGVDRVDPILRAFVRAESPGMQGARLTLLGIQFRGPDGLGGPAMLIAGTMPHGQGEVALDRAAAHRLDTRLDDNLSVNGIRVKVVGITSGTNLLTTQFVFGDIDADLQRIVPGVSFGVIRTTAGTDMAQVGARIHARFPDIEVMDRDSFTANNLREIGAGFLPMLLLMSMLGATSSALLVAFLIEGVVEQRRASLAVLLATGATTGSIAAGLALHVAKLLGFGLLLGVVAAHILATVIDLLAPVIPLRYAIADLAAVVTLLAVSGLLAAFVPLIRLKNIDPLEAFRA